MVQKDIEYEKIKNQFLDKIEKTKKKVTNSKALTYRDKYNKKSFL